MDYARLLHAAWDEGGAPIKVFGPKPLAQITETIFGPDGLMSHDLREQCELPQSQQVWLAGGGWRYIATSMARAGDHRNRARIHV